jgi:hypothetical protein
LIPQRTWIRALLTLESLFIPNSTTMVLPNADTSSSNDSQDSSISQPLPPPQLPTSIENSSHRTKAIFNFITTVWQQQVNRPLEQPELQAVADSAVKAQWQSSAIFYGSIFAFSALPLAIPALGRRCRALPENFLSKRFTQGGFVSTFMREAPLRVPLIFFGMFTGQVAGRVVLATTLATAPAKDDRLRSLNEELTRVYKKRIEEGPKGRQVLMEQMARGEKVAFDREMSGKRERGRRPPGSRQDNGVERQKEWTPDDSSPQSSRSSSMSSESIPSISLPSRTDSQLDLSSPEGSGPASPWDSDFDDDDASPIATPQRSGSRGNGNQGTMSWDEIRSRAAGGENSPSRSRNNGGFGDNRSPQPPQRSDAQKDFDKRMERERQGKDEYDSKGKSGR